MTWTCAAIDHGVTLYQSGKIAPCCMIDHSYLKDITELGHDPFADLRTETPPQVCYKCVQEEQHGVFSYRQQLNASKKEIEGIQFVDIRNSNLCNLKCRTCTPKNSSQWAIELGHAVPIIKQDITDYKKFIVSPSVRSIYYTGGEPFINAEHWELLEELINNGYSKNISLLYNSNLTTLKFKNKNILDLWKKFKLIKVMASIDAIGEKFNYIRSGADWDIVNSNMLILNKQVDLTIATTVSILNIWFIDELLEYFKGYKIELTNLYDPDYLSLSVIPDSLKPMAHKCIDRIEKLYYDKNKISYMRSQIDNNINQQFFKDTLIHVLLLDNIRNEKLFDLLPFKHEAITRAFKNL
jgi:sulfatase maturation enzyme AslB (radical SAM superfamily)